MLHYLISELVRRDVGALSLSTMSDSSQFRSPDDEYDDFEKHLEYLSRKLAFIFYIFCHFSMI